jgi:hypothetical protein
VGPFNFCPNSLVWALRGNCGACALTMFTVSKENTTRLVEEYSLQVVFSFYCTEINKLLPQPPFLLHT